MALQLENSHAMQHATCTQTRHIWSLPMPSSDVKRLTTAAIVMMMHVMMLVQNQKGMSMIIAGRIQKHSWWCSHWLRERLPIWSMQMARRRSQWCSRRWSYESHGQWWLLLGQQWIQQCGAYCLSVVVFLFEFALLVDAIARFNHAMPFFLGQAKCTTNAVAVHVKAIAAPATMIRLQFSINCEFVFVVCHML